MPCLVFELIAVKESVCTFAVLDGVAVVIVGNNLCGLACVIVAESVATDRAEDSSGEDDADSLFHGSISLSFFVVFIVSHG